MINTPTSQSRIVRHARVAPETVLAVLSQSEVQALCEQPSAALSELFRQCALAVLSSGVQVDDAPDLFSQFNDFQIELVAEDGGLKLDLHNAPAAAFVGGRMIRGVQEHLFAVLRDLIYTTQELESGRNINLDTSAGITDGVFRIVRNAGILPKDTGRALTVCWGGHAIKRAEYDYTKQVGYALGLRGLDVCTGCGAGAMKGPMKGATIAHAKQRITDGRYIGITEPGIIAAEAPNPIVNALVIMPDIEKRLEAFVRLAHGIIIFPGGVGTTEELLYLLGVLAHPNNQAQQLTVVLTGPPESAAYFAALDEFVRFVLGAESAARYQIVIADPDAVADIIAAGATRVRSGRSARGDATYFNWQLAIDLEYQQPFVATHEAMMGLALNRHMPGHELASNLRRVFSGIVAGNVKGGGIAAVAAKGPFQVRGEQALMHALDGLLRQFVEQGRMHLSKREYKPCYEIVA